MAIRLTHHRYIQRAGELAIRIRRGGFFWRLCLRPNGVRGEARTSLTGQSPARVKNLCQRLYRLPAFPDKSTNDARQPVGCTVGQITP